MVVVVVVVVVAVVGVVAVLGGVSWAVVSRVGASLVEVFVESCEHVSDGLSVVLCFAHVVSHPWNQFLFLLRFDSADSVQLSVLLQDRSDLSTSYCTLDCSYLTLDLLAEPALSRRIS